VTETYAERFSLSPAGAVDAPGAVLLGTSPGHATDLKPGASVAFSANVTVPVGTPPGAYSLLVQADGLHAVAEVNEHNNVAAAALMVSAPPPPGKDLAIENLVLSRSSVKAGGSVTVRYRVANRGTVTVTEAHAERFHLSRDAQLDSADAPLVTGVSHTADMAPNSTYAYSRSFIIPPGTAPGGYYILVQDDALAAVTEIDEDNNTAAVPLTVTGP
jgi:subtilase family serine protease